MLFTHFGLSGPAVLRCSQFVVKELMKTGYEPVTMRIQTLTNYNEETCLQYLNKLIKEDPKKGCEKMLGKVLLLNVGYYFLCERANIDVQLTGAELSQDKIRHLARLLVNFTLTVSGTQSLDKAFVTGGGVSVKEIEPKTMASKRKEGLFFCGEILDIHGYTGGI
ncbi:NAD(P)/FAD-dependent oxidoreductase [Lysinibacillus sp. MHQ-1]|nr:NAD(P)/FAD-dependent oxidoreductase [Lysinibacillus sp. MHQ-1]